MQRYRAICPILLLLFACLPHEARANIESRWGAQELYTHREHLRYLLLFPPHYDPHRKYELWLSLHGDPGCAEQGIYFYFPEAQQREVFLLAPQGTGYAAESYVRPDGSKGVYHALDKKHDPAHILSILDEVTANYPIDQQRIALFGFSAGCLMGWRLLAARPNEFYFYAGIANGFWYGRPPAGAEALRQAAKHVVHFYAAGQGDNIAGPLFKFTAKRLKQYGFELKTVHPAGVGHALPPAIKVPLMTYLDAVRARKWPKQTMDGRTLSPKLSASMHNRRGGLFAGFCCTGGLLLTMLALGLRAHLLRERQTRSTRANASKSANNCYPIQHPAMNGTG